MRRLLLPLLLAALALAGPAWGVTREEQDKIDKLKEIAVGHLKKKQYLEAVPLLNEILLINPKDTAAARYLLIANRKIVEPYCRLAAEAYLEGHYAEALKHWEKILEINPDDRRVIHLMDDTIRLLNENTLDFLYEEADRLFREERYEDAAEQWEKILLINPEEERASDLLEITKKIIIDRRVRDHYRRADELIAEEEYGRAINELKAVLDIDPGQKRASRLVASLYQKMLAAMYAEAEDLYTRGAYQLARDQYYRIMAANPEDQKLKPIVDRLNGLIGVMPGLEEEGELWDILRRGLRHHIRPDGDPEVAIVAARYARSLKPDDLRLGALVDYLERQYPTVVAAMERPEKDMNVIDQILFVALNDFYEGRYDRVVRKCRIILELQPRNVLALKRLGSAYFALGQKDRARETWTRALEISPGDAELKDYIRQAR